jgi:hypothetical protein
MRPRPKIELMPIPRKILERIKVEYIAQSETKLDVAEAEEGGKGRVTFSLSSSCIRVRLPRQPIKWLRNQRSADAIIIQTRGEAVHLHLIELKSKMSASEWLKTKEQSDGAYLNALAIGALWKLPDFASVNLHVAYREDRLRSADVTAPSVLKRGLGERLPVDVSDWLGTTSN